MSFSYGHIRHIICLAFLASLISCATVNLATMPLMPPQSSMKPRTSMDLYVDSMTFQGVVPKNSTETAEPIMMRYIHNKNFFNSVFSAGASGEGKPQDLRIKVFIRPKEDFKFNWLITWPAVYPMPLYWPIQYRKGTVSVALRCEVYRNNGSLLTQVETEHREDYLTKFYGFFRTADAKAKMINCYESVFAQLAEKIVTDKYVVELGRAAPRGEPSRVVAQTPTRKTAARSRPKPAPIVEEANLYKNINFGKYYALIIGINDYKHLPKLKTAVNDANTVADVLQKNYGFNVKRLINPTRTEIISQLSYLRRTMTKNDNLLIYYAGHGWLDKLAQEGYWLPVDASQDNEANWLSNATVTANVRALQAKHIMVIADSCYSGNLTRGLHIKQKTPDYLTRMAKQKTRVVLASGGLEPVEDSGGKNNHSVFASALISTLEENRGILDGTELFVKIKRPVMVNSEQTPEYGDIRKAGHDGGDFLFVFGGK